MTDDKPTKPRIGPAQRSTMELIKLGIPLCVQYGRGKDKFYSSDGSTVNQDAAERCMNNGYFTANTDGLFGDMGQSLRLSQKGIEALSA